MCDMSVTHALIMLRGMRSSRYAVSLIIWRGIAHHLTRHPVTVIMKYRHRTAAKRLSACKSNTIKAQTL